MLSCPASAPRGHAFPHIGARRATAAAGARSSHAKLPPNQTVAGADGRTSICCVRTILLAWLAACCHHSSLAGSMACTGRDFLGAVLSAPPLHLHLWHAGVYHPQCPCRPRAMSSGSAPATAARSLAHVRAVKIGGAHRACRLSHRLCEVRWRGTFGSKSCFGERLRHSVNGITAMLRRSKGRNILFHPVLFVLKKEL